MRSLSRRLSTTALALSRPILAGIAASALLAACGGGPEPLRPAAEWGMEGGGTVGSILPADGDTAVLLVYAPSQCFSCDGELSHWLATSRQRGWPVHLLLTAAPSPAERDQLRLFRLEPAGVLRGAAARLTTPRVYRYAGRVPLDSAIGSPAEHGMLRRAARAPADSGAGR